MTNYERLLDRPLREVLKEFGEPSLEKVSDGFSFMCECDDERFLPCQICAGVPGGCSTVCNVWFNKESAPDANYNDQYWRDASEEPPACGDTTERYLAVIYGASQPTLLAYDGDNFIDPDTDDYITYKVRYWRPQPKLPVIENDK